MDDEEVEVAILSEGEGEAGEGEVVEDGQEGDEMQ